MAKWSKQDYEMVAEVLRTVPLDEQARIDVAFKFAGMFAADNPNFRINQFFRAAGIPMNLEREADIARGWERGAVQRRPGDIPVVSHVRRRPRRSIVDIYGHRIRVKEWPSQAGMATLRRHYKRKHPVAWRLSIAKGVRTRRRRRDLGGTAPAGRPRRSTRSGRKGSSRGSRRRSGTSSNSRRRSGGR